MNILEANNNNPKPTKNDLNTLYEMLEYIKNKGFKLIQNKTSGNYWHRLRQITTNSTCTMELWLAYDSYNEKYYLKWQSYTEIIKKDNLAISSIEELKYSIDNIITTLKI